MLRAWSQLAISCPCHTAVQKTCKKYTTPWVTTTRLSPLLQTVLDRRQKSIMESPAASRMGGGKGGRRKRDSLTNVGPYVLKCEKVFEKGNTFSNIRGGGECQVGLSKFFGEHEGEGWKGRKKFQTRNLPPSPTLWKEQS